MYSTGKTFTGIDHAWSFLHEINPALEKSSFYNVLGGVAPATVASSDMISMEIRDNLTIHYSVRLRSDSSINLKITVSSDKPRAQVHRSVGLPSGGSRDTTDASRSVIPIDRSGRKILRNIGSVETLRFNKLRITYFRRGQCLPPRTAPALCDGVVLPSLELSLQKGLPSGGGGGITCRSPQER